MYGEAEMSKKVKLRNLAKVIRSKNSGPFELTLDIMFDKEEIYQKVKKIGVINKALISRLYQVSEDKILCLEPYDQALAIKITLVRPIDSGSIGETDTYGGQQHAPLMDIDIPWADDWP
jgi:hypothetical protein